MISKLLNPDSVWETSTFSDIPTIPDAHETIRHFCIVAGGLALILSRNKDTAIRLHYPYTVEMYELLGKELRKYGRTSAGAGLINNVMHEVAQVADPITMSSLKRCLENRCNHDVLRKAAREEEGDSRPREASGFLSRIGRKTLQGPDLSASSAGIETADQRRAQGPDVTPEAARRLKEAVENARRQRSAAVVDRRGA